MKLYDYYVYEIVGRNKVTIVETQLKQIFVASFYDFVNGCHFV